MKVNHKTNHKNESTHNIYISDEDEPLLKRRRYNDNRKRKVDDAELSEGESQI